MYQNHLKRVSLSGFKSIKQLDLELGPINILIGANGAGKSNFISIFTFFKNILDGNMQYHIKSNGLANSFLHFGPKVTDKIRLDIQFDPKGYHAEFIHDKNDDLLLFNFEHGSIKNSENVGTLVRSIGDDGLPNYAVTESKFVYSQLFEDMKKCCVYHFHDTSSAAYFKQAQRLDSSVILRPDAANLAIVLYYIKRYFPDDYYQIVLEIRTVAPFFHDFHFEPQGEPGNEFLLLRWIHNTNNGIFSANQLSDGTARFICLATLFLQPAQHRPSTIVIDEPELGLHPNAIENLAEMIKSVSETNQVIISTQSVELANYFEPEDFIVVEEHNGVSEFKRLEREPLEVWLEEYGMGQIWTKNIVGGNPK